MEHPPQPVPQVRRAAFVTLRVNGELRGCLGRVTADRAVGELVPALTVAAAREDPRFPALREDELGATRIEVSVLGTLRPLRDPADEIVIGRDGLVVEQGSARGLLLPQVAAEQGWAPAAFLQAACEKAGLTPGAWRAPDTRVFAFEADVFQEPEPR